MTDVYDREKRSAVNAATSGSAKMMPSTTRDPVTTSRALTTLLPSRHADSFPDEARCFVNVPR